MEVGGEWIYITGVGGVDIHNGGRGSGYNNGGRGSGYNNGGR